MFNYLIPFCARLVQIQRRRAIGCGSFRIMSLHLTSLLLLFKWIQKLWTMKLWYVEAKFIINHCHGLHFHNLSQPSSSIIAFALKGHNAMDNNYVTLHEKTGTKVIGRSQHANTTRLACPVSWICAYLNGTTI